MSSEFRVNLILKKLPGELNKDEHVILKLSQDDKLFMLVHFINSDIISRRNADCFSKYS